MVSKYQVAEVLRKALVHARDKTGEGRKKAFVGTAAIYMHKVISKWIWLSFIIGFSVYIIGTRTINYIIHHYEQQVNVPFGTQDSNPQMLQRSPGRYRNIPHARRKVGRSPMYSSTELQEFGKRNVLREHTSKPVLLRASIHQRRRPVIHDDSFGPRRGMQERRTVEKTYEMGSRA